MSAAVAPVGSTLIFCPTERYHADRAHELAERLRAVLPGVDIVLVEGVSDVVAVTPSEGGEPDGAEIHRTLLKLKRERGSLSLGLS